MALLPLSLVGDNLGQRHRYLNLQVHLAATGDQVSFKDFEFLPEQSAVDRLFKIDVAIKLKNVDYILKSLRDDDMLYVSRALKCKWLVERQDIINPKYLEDVLFPQMVTPAISKMKHWLYINLTDSAVCQQFYEYHKNIKFDFAVKFLRHCDNEFLLNEFPKILVQVSPHYLKVLGEKCPELVKIYFDSLATDNELAQRYLKEEQCFYNSTKYLLKTFPDIFLDVTEKYYDLKRFKKLSPSLTKYILRHHKSRFIAKCELYTVHLLDMPTLAQQLSGAECQELIVKLAQAAYLGPWFSYQRVEPLIKRIRPGNRAHFKKRVFVDKDVGDRVTEWPYLRPASPAVKAASSKGHVFIDKELRPIRLKRNMGRRMDRECMLSSKFFTSCAPVNCCLLRDVSKKTELEKLFDEFRFLGFEATLSELEGRLTVTSSADRRRDFLLVLVSKSGGHPDFVRKLMKLALRLKNEPVHERAAVIRSLAKRACFWRLPNDVWEMVLDYSPGLGLDGSRSEARCVEGLHAVVIRAILASGDIEPVLRNAFFNNFSTLVEYKLTPKERSAIGAGLQRLLLTASAEPTNPEDAARRLGQLLDVLEIYGMNFKSAISAVAVFCDRDPDGAKSFLERLYKARVGRRELFHQYLKLRTNDAALLNALRHDPDAVTPEWLIKLLINRKTRPKHFLLKVSIYFNEARGIATEIRQALQDKITQKPNVDLVQPLVILAGNDILSILREQHLAGSDNYKMSAAIRANMHRARPAPDALALGWREVGMKAVARQVIRCRPALVTQITHMLLEERVKQTIRLALALVRRSNCAADLFSIAVTIRPLAALRAAVLYFRDLGEKADLRVWDIVKSHIVGVDLTIRPGLCYTLKKIDWVPDAIKLEYCTLLYHALEKVSDTFTDRLCQQLMICLPAVSDNHLRAILLQILDKFHIETFPALYIRYLMLSKSDDEENLRFKDIVQPFLKKVETYCKGNDKYKYNFYKMIINQILNSLLYHLAFFDVNYQCCLSVIQRVLIWISEFLPKEKNFDKYVKLNATILYFEAIRHSIKQKPEIFTDPEKKTSEGVDVVGFTFGRYITRELAELKSNYFDSIIELYSKAVGEYLNEYFIIGPSKYQFIAAVVKGILSENAGSEGRLAIHLINIYGHWPVFKEMKKLVLEHNDKEVQIFAHAAFIK